MSDSILYNKSDYLSSGPNSVIREQVDFDVILTLQGNDIGMRR